MVTVSCNAKEARNQAGCGLEQWSVPWNLGTIKASIHESSICQRSVIDLRNAWMKIMQAPGVFYPSFCAPFWSLASSTLSRRSDFTAAACWWPTFRQPSMLAVLEGWKTAGWPIDYRTLFLKLVKDDHWYSQTLEDHTLGHDDTCDMMMRVPM